MSGLRGLVVPAALIVTAEVAFRLFEPETDALAPPSDVTKAAWAAVQDGSLLAASLQTLTAAAGGLAIGGLLGLIAGLTLGSSQRLAASSFLTIEALRPVPAIALIPLSMLIFGFGFKMEISIIAIAVFWPVLLMSESALKGIAPELIEVARILELGSARTFGAIILPALLPRLLTALRLAAALSLVVAVTVEIFGNPQGLGYAISTSEQGLDPATSLAFLVWVGVLGFGVNWGLARIQRALGRPLRTGRSP